LSRIFRWTMTFSKRRHGETSKPGEKKPGSHTCLYEVECSAEEGWRVNHKRVERIWRQEGLKVPKKQPKKGRLWLADGSCIRLRPEKKDHVWSYDFAMIRTTDGRPIRLLVIIDEYTRECLSLKVASRLRSQDVLDQLYELFLKRNIPEYIRSDNGPEFTAKAVRDWLANIGVSTLYIEPGSP
jgi:putative transposase